MMASEATTSNRDKDFVLEDAFIAKRGEAIYFGKDVTGSFSRNHLYLVDGYTPPLFRRPRLRRLAPLARRVDLMRGVWKWSASG